MAEAAQYQVVAPAYIVDRLYHAGDVVEYDGSAGAPGANLLPLNDAAKKAKADAAKASPLLSPREAALHREKAHLQAALANGPATDDTAEARIKDAEDEIARLRAELAKRDNPAVDPAIETNATTDQPHPAGANTAENTDKRRDDKTVDGEDDKRATGKAPNRNTKDLI